MANAYAGERQHLQQAIEEDQHELHQALDDLKVAASQTLDPGAYVGGNPWPWLAGALLAGVWVGFRWRRATRVTVADDA